MGDAVYELLSADEMTVLKEHYKAVKDGNMAKWPADRKKFVARLYEKIREKGYRLVGEYPSGSPKFAAIKKSVVEQIMDLSDEDYQLYLAGKITFVGYQMHRVNEACQ